LVSRLRSRPARRRAEAILARERARPRLGVDASSRMAMASAELRTQLWLLVWTAIHPRSNASGVRGASPGHCCTCCCTYQQRRRDAAYFVIRFGSGAGIRTLNLAVNRSTRPVQKSISEFAGCRRIPPFSSLCQRRCCTASPSREMGSVSTKGLG